MELSVIVCVCVWLPRKSVQFPPEFVSSANSEVSRTKDTSEMLHYLLTLFPLAALLTKRLSARQSTRMARGHMRL